MQTHYRTLLLLLPFLIFLLHQLQFLFQALLQLHHFEDPADKPRNLLEPRRFAQASKDQNWVEAMEKELHALETNDTWDLTTLPPHKKAIGSKWIDEVKTYLDNLFTIKELGPVKHFLGLQLARSLHGLLVTQTKYLTSILEDIHLVDAKPASTPLPPGFKFSQDDGSLLPCPEQYRRLVGRLLYLGFSRPDISFFVQQLSQFLQHPHTSHWNAAIHVLCYLKGTLSLGLFFSAHGSFQLTAYSDASWVACLDTRRSITGFCIFLGSSLISSKMKKQATVSHSFAEAAIWVPQFVNFFGFPTFFVNFRSHLHYLFHFGVITRPLAHHCQLCVP
ncbi:UNVERIFIED_CONTAM: Retrovirus-related Pol polyprotein from transposon RE2 [Sesamum radiatum]|uniref:Retrovirus-related Pol polyprotein from transposon RE2 n=1 Tax=Sesamum radiatum TaxID=300843 RepID=A0AAW2UPB8_SESRA